MTDNFFSKSCCDRCGGTLKNGRIMSMFNEDCICIKCSNEERKQPDFKKAVEADIEQIKQGNYSFNGIGYNKK